MFIKKIRTRAEIILAMIPGDIFFPGDALGCITIHDDGYNMAMEGEQKISLNGGQDLLRRIVLDLYNKEDYIDAEILK